MSAESDPGLAKQLLEWAWAGVLALGGIVFKGVKDDIGKKADVDRVVSLEKNMDQRIKIEEKLFDKIAEESAKTSVQVSQVVSQINRGHIELLNAIHDKKKQ